MIAATWHLGIRDALNVCSAGEGPIPEIPESGVARPRRVEAGL